MLSLGWAGRQITWSRQGPCGLKASPSIQFAGPQPLHLWPTVLADCVLLLPQTANWSLTCHLYTTQVYLAQGSSRRQECGRGACGTFLLSPTTAGARAGQVGWGGRAQCTLSSEATAQMANCVLHGDSGPLTSQRPTPQPSEGETPLEQQAGCEM